MPWRRSFIAEKDIYSLKVFLRDSLFIRNGEMDSFTVERPDRLYVNQ